MVSVRCFGVRVSVMFHFVFVHYTFSSVWVAEWPPFGKYSLYKKKRKHYIIFYNLRTFKDEHFKLTGDLDWHVPYQ